MRAKNTIVINGKVYDAISGLPAGAPDVASSSTTKPKTPARHATTAAISELKSSSQRTSAQLNQVKHKRQRSQTLRRDLLKKPATQTHAHIRRKPQAGHHATSPMVSKFAKHPQPMEHSLATHLTPPEHIRPAQASTTARPKTVPQLKEKALSSRELKEKLIAERLATVQATPLRHHKAPRKSFFERAPRASTVVVACLAIVFLGGYLTYINMPNLSMRVAAARSGVNASFPDYRPDGYRFNGPISYNNGEVSVQFASNTNKTAGYTVNQKNSNWDSQAVLENYVTKQSRQYLTYSEQGITIYTFDSKAAWVNGGVFYTIDGNAPLSSEQILRIAASM